VRASSPHKQRPQIDPRHPQHITLRVEKAVAALRRMDMYAAIRRAMRTVLGRDLFRIVEISLQDGHLHLLVECENRDGLARGLQAFQIAAARYLNQAVEKRTGKERRGRVFSDRYHARALTSPLAVRHARAYVLNNWRRHQKDRGWESVNWTIDKFSSAILFDGWKETNGLRFRAPPDYEPLPVMSARTWLLSTGWKKHGLISTREVPGKLAERLVR
jgi:REP element-mobilizing transposase RayT